MRRLAPVLLPIVTALLPADAAHADALRSAAIGCSTPADAEKIAALQERHDRAGAEAIGRPLLASRACLDFAKGRVVDVDERRPPLACIRLPGDLSCYWVTLAALDEHPGEKGKGGRQGGGRRR